MVSNRSFDRLNLTHKRTLAFRCYCFCFLRNCTLTFKHRLNVLPIIADCILYIESDENCCFHREELNLLLDSISTLCSFQCSRSVLTELIQYNSFPASCQQLFSSFLTFVFLFGAVVSDSFYILPNHSIFVNCFFHLFQDC